MPRKNKCAQKRRQKVDRSPYKRAPRSRSPLLDEKIVRPVGLCPKSHKLKFDTEENAATALTQARAAHRGSGRIEKRYYKCPDCSGFHLTSRETWVDREGKNDE